MKGQRHQAQMKDTGSTARVKEQLAHSQRNDVPRHLSSDLMTLPQRLGQVGNGTIERLLNIGDDGGQPLLPQFEAEMTKAFNSDFSRVRVHRDPFAHRAAHSLDAEAFTIGEDIYLGAEAPTSESTAGQSLIAHELAHVTQQRMASSLTPAVSRASDPSELTADQAAHSALQGEPAAIAAGGAPPAIQRQPRRRGARESEEPTEADLSNPMEFIGKQLRRRFSDPDDPRLAQRRRWLNRAFDLLESDVAKELLERLTKKPAGDEVAEGFHRLHKVTQKELLDILRRKIGQGESYQKKLQEAINLLSSVAFGRCEGAQPTPDPADKYDKRYWVEEDVTDPQTKHKQAQLVLKAGIKPSFAIDEIFANLNLWSFDCAQYVQVAELYALRHSLGTDTFDSFVSGGPFLIKHQFSTGLITKKMWGREKPGEPLTRFDSATSKAQETKSVDEVLAEAPIGSRIVWTNLDTRADNTDFKNENAIKLGPDRFAAHPWGEVSRKDLEFRLAKASEPKVTSADDDYVKKNIFISRIQHFKTP